MTINVTIQPKSAWQKDDCLFCDNESTLEAAATTGPGWFATIRCCPSHTERATEFVKEYAKNIKETP